MANVAGDQGIWRIKNNQQPRYTEHQYNPEENETTKTGGRQNPTRFPSELANIPPNVSPRKVNTDRNEKGRGTSDEI